jgi:hypothetical protein
MPSLADRPLRWYFPPALVALWRICMSQQERIEALKEKHAALERAIEEENTHPQPNNDMISGLKRQKLRIKDEIYQLERL